MAVTDNELPFSACNSGSGHTGYQGNNEMCDKTVGKNTEKKLTENVHNKYNDNETVT